MARPAESEFSPFYAGYVATIPETKVLPILESQPAELLALAARVGADREQYRYAAGKWSVREAIGHIGDTERVFGYRAFCISRGEQQALPGFDENAYMEVSRFNERSAVELAREFAAAREANLSVLRHLLREDWDRAGTAAGNHITLRAITFIMAGHVRHHIQILRDRYLIQ